MKIEQIPRDELRIVLLTKRHELTPFNSKNDDLNEFLKNDALKDQEEMINKTYLSFWKNGFVGYFSIVADTIEVHAIDENDEIKGYPYHKYPSIKIARLAVDRRFERKGVGGFLVLAAIGLAVSVSEIIGCRYITVDSKPESINFYEKVGFKIVEKYKCSEFPKMYLDLYPIVSMMQPTESMKKFER